MSRPRKTETISFKEMNVWAMTYLTMGSSFLKFIGYWSQVEWIWIVSPVWFGLGIPLIVVPLINKCLARVVITKTVLIPKIKPEKPVIEKPPVEENIRLGGQRVSLGDFAPHIQAQIKRQMTEKVNQWI